MLYLSRGGDNVNKAFKFRVYPTSEQELLLNKTFGCVRYIYNHFLALRKASYNYDKITLNFYDNSADLTELKKHFPWLKEVDSVALQQSLRDLDRAYKNFFKRKIGFPKFKSKKIHRYSYRTHSVKLSDDCRYVKLPKLGLVKLAGYSSIEGRILNATLSKTSSGKYFISFSVTDISDKYLERTNKNVGIDLGIKDLIITSDGKKYENHKYLSKSLARLRRFSKLHSRKARGSKNKEKARIRLARYYEKVTNQRKDILNKISTELVKAYDIICVENLNISNMVKNHNLARNINDASWGEFVRQLEYKCEWYGKKLVKVNTFFPSSQLCSSCGSKFSKVKDLSVRNWVCPNCKTLHDRDINASINILKEGLRTIGTMGIACGEVQ